LLGDRTLVDAVLEDFRGAPIGDAEKALFAFVELVNRASTSVGPEHVAAVKAAGWSDEALYDAISVCALFNFYNKWIDATGVSDLPADAYLASGDRLAARGYVPEPSSK
jgi:alkylhydroperoxidase family enzyme